MSHKSTAVLAITICLIIAANCDQGLDCRKLVYSRNCRGVAIKRDLGNGETQSGNFRDNINIRRLLYDLIPVTDSSLLEDFSSKKSEERRENDLRKDSLQLDHLLYKLLVASRRRNPENDNFLSYEY